MPFPEHVHDGALLRAWSDYRAVTRRFTARLSTLPAHRVTPVSKRMIRLEQRIAALPAHSLDGVAVKLRLLLVQHGTPETEAAAFDGTPLPAAVLDDDGLRTLWSLIGSIDSMKRHNHGQWNV